jgi:hypothetical protein
MNTPDHSQRKHAKRSPSGLGKVAVCPHFQQDNDRPVHPVTLEGTRIHEAIETRTLAGLTEDQKNMAERAIQYWNDLLRTGPWSERIEVKIAIPHMDFGHADLLLVHKDGKTGHLIDWKTGFNKQAPTGVNAQQRAYAAGIFRSLPELEALTVHIVYVRLQEADVETFRRSDVAEMELQLIAIDRCAEEAVRFAEENPGVLKWHRADPAACSYCVHAGACPALSAIAQPIVNAYASARPEDLVVPEAYDPALITDPNVMSKAMMVAEVMERWVSSVKKHALNLRLSGGMEIPGTNLVSKAGSKSIIDAATAHRVAEEHGLSYDAFMTAVEVSAAKLLKAAEAKAPRGKKKLAAQNLEDALRDANALTFGAETFYLRRVKKPEGEKTVDV